MGRRGREEAALQALARRVWGDRYFEQHARRRSSRRQQLGAVAGLGIGGPLLLTALVLSWFPGVASAHTSTITISCTQVSFSYQDFPTVTATSHESVAIDGVEVADRDVTFVGPSTTDTITISVGSGTHTVVASDQWVFNGVPQGNATDTQLLSDCAPTSTTTTSETSTSTTSSTTTSSTSTTTVPPTSTSTSTSTSTVPETTTTAPVTSTSASTTTTLPASSTTTVGPVTTTTRRAGGSTTTTSPVHEQGSTFPTTPPTTTPNGTLPFTGSSDQSLVAGLGAVGVGMLAVGLASLRRMKDRT